MTTPPLHLTGGRTLTGEIPVLGSKNAALPLIVASLLTAEPVVLHRVPRLSDIETLLEVLRHLGTHAEWLAPGTLLLHTPALRSTHVPYELGSTIRGTFQLLGALVARAGEGAVPSPGGCTFSARPVDQHVQAFEALGIEVTFEDGTHIARRPRALSGGFFFDVLTVGGTQNAVLASVLGAGEVRLEQASIDTDVLAMIDFLNALGADIRGAGTHTLEVHGVAALRGGEYTVIPDRIEAGTFMLLAAATRSRLTVSDVDPGQLRAVSAKLEQMGARVTPGLQTLTVDATRSALRAVNITTREYPGFPTDVQPQAVAALATIPGTSLVLDRVYPERLSHVGELGRMGAQLRVVNQTQVINGAALSGTQVRAANIRDGAALVIAALAAEGDTVLEGMEYLRRGYERLPERLQAIGASVQLRALASAAD